ncbi:acyl-[acyl-carrier-protein] thioesterase [Bdellovibrio svalbardensis]|uniref:Thioesterase n=1 Tax=Bdellovibrio svalbardensis TaxID=2972972 RepID=A0ABT6DGV6_9BACT|nr:acyl-ACP thioesterase domain-containing protein [Bdellovibrio svalbardensis]MDG0816085.1 thioesterase [Bdellovibrio svalbardensis]
MSQEIKKLWSERFKITSLLVNPMGRLGLYGVLNLIQETAWMHAETLGFGIKDMEQQGLFWVLTRQTLQMSSWPAIGQHICVETWLRPPDGAFVSREFFLKDDNGEIIGRCSTSWLALDRRTKKILPSQDLRPWEQICLDQSNGLITEKIPVQGAYESLAKFRVRNSDLDTNQHVNNTKYAQWILDSIHYDLHKSLALKSYSVNFLAETHLGDKVKVERSCSAPSVDEVSAGITTYRGARLEDDKILFTARLEWEKIKA